MDSAQLDMRNARIRSQTLTTLSDDYTQDQYDEEYSRQTTLEAFKELRLERNIKLKKTDHLMVSDFPYPSEDIRAAWVTYRQNLRNIPITSPPSFDEDSQLVVAWPTPPIWPANVV
jgi:hypothetical protein